MTSTGAPFFAATSSVFPGKPLVDSTSRGQITPPPTRLMLEGPELISGRLANPLPSIVPLLSN